MSDSKHSVEHIPSSPSTPVKANPDKIVVTEEDDKRIRKATDKWVLSMLCWVYFLQILDKSVVGYSTAFGLKTDAHLTGTQYSTIAAAGYYGQAAIAPISAMLLIRVPIKILIPTLVFCWGASLCGMAASHDYKGLLVSRTLLGIFEAAVLPMFTIIVSNWYRRSEQPFRVAAFYSTNGIATILGSFLSWALGHIKSGPLHSYQIIFLTTGLVTVVTAPIIYFLIDNSVAEARFLSPEDRLKGVERLKSNKTGLGLDHDFKWRQMFEVFYEPKTWMWMAMNLFLNAGASVANAFGPILLGSFGFDSYTLTLLNMPFGALQFIFIWATSWAAWHFSKKSPIFLAAIVPPIAGLAVLYTQGRGTADRAANLVGYYLLAPLFAGNPLLIAWLAANTAGHTKKATIMTFFQAFLAAGNIAGPFLFTDKDKPYYYHGILVVLGFFIAIAGLIVMCVFWLAFLNKLQERRRVKNGKPAKLEDLSMTKHFAMQTEDTEAALAQQVQDHGLHDKTDRENDEFIYVY